MAIDSGIVERVRASFDRCAKDKNFIKTFYDNLFASEPSIQPKFSNTLFSVQETLVKHGMRKLLAFAGGDGGAQGELDLIRESHNRNHMAIKPEWYTLFIDNMVKTASQFDPEYSSDLGGDWRAVMQPGINHIKAGY